MRLAAFIYDMKLSILDNNDITSEASWRRVLRNVVRTAGIEDCPHLLYVVPGTGACHHFLRVGLNLFIIWSHFITFVHIKIA